MAEENEQADGEIKVDEGAQVTVKQEEMVNEEEKKSEV